MNLVQKAGESKTARGVSHILNIVVTTILIPLAVWGASRFMSYVDSIKDNTDKLTSVVAELNGTIGVLSNEVSNLGDAQRETSQRVSRMENSLFFMRPLNDPKRNKEQQPREYPQERN